MTGIARRVQTDSVAALLVRSFNRQREARLQRCDKAGMVSPDDLASFGVVPRHVETDVPRVVVGRFAAEAAEIPVVVAHW